MPTLHNQRQLTPDAQGQLDDSLIDPRTLGQRSLALCSIEIQGDAIATGTVVLALIVPAGKILYVTRMVIVDKTATTINPTYFKIVNANGNDPAALGYTEILIDFADASNLPAAMTEVANGEIGDQLQFAEVLDNRIGTTDAWFLIYAPGTRITVVNNAITQYWQASIKYFIE